MAAASSSHTGLRAHSAALNDVCTEVYFGISSNPNQRWNFIASNTSAAHVRKEKKLLKYLLLGVCLTLYYQLRSEEQWTVERRYLESRQKSAALNKREFKDLGPSHRPIYCFYPVCSCKRVDVCAHTHTSVILLMYTPPLCTLSLQAGLFFQPSHRAKSSLLILFCCQSALFQLNEKKLAAPKKHDPAVELKTDLIRSDRSHGILPVPTKLTCLSN